MKKCSQRTGLYNTTSVVTIDEDCAVVNYSLNPSAITGYFFVLFLKIINVGLTQFDVAKKNLNNFFCIKVLVFSKIFIKLRIKTTEFLINFRNESYPKNCMTSQFSPQRLPSPLIDILLSLISKSILSSYLKNISNYFN